MVSSKELIRIFEAQNGLEPNLYFEKLATLFQQLKRNGFSFDFPLDQRMIQEVISSPSKHYLGQRSEIADYFKSFYDTNDLLYFHDLTPFSPLLEVKSIEDLLKGDEQRVKDGFSKKIKFNKITRTTRNGKKKSVIVPTTNDDKFYHERGFDKDGLGGAGEGEVGDVISSEPLYQNGEEGEGAGDGSDDHELENNAYNLGRVLSEKLKLKLDDKQKKTVLRKKELELTDKKRGSGQLLDKKKTLRNIVQTNLRLGRIEDINNIDATKLIIQPKDKEYYVFSEELVYESQALLLFARDYSGSMTNEITEVVVKKDFFLYSLLRYEYDKLIKSRFFVHDFEAKEVKNFNTYLNLNEGGGTRVSSVFKLMNEIVEEENLAKDYNIFVFYGTDGDDWGTKDLTAEALREIKKTLSYANKLGITIVRNHTYSSSNTETQVEEYLKMR